MWSKDVGRGGLVGVVPKDMAHVVQFTHIEQTFLLVNGCDGQVIVYSRCFSGESCVGQNQTSQ